MFEVGTRVVAIKGENDYDENDQHRETGPNAEGYIDQVLHGEANPNYVYYSVVFSESGVCVFLDDTELANSEEYTILPSIGKVSQ